MKPKITGSLNPTWKSELLQSDEAKAFVRNAVDDVVKALNSKAPLNNNIISKDYGYFLHTEGTWGATGVVWAARRNLPPTEITKMITVVTGEINSIGGFRKK